MKTKTLGLAMLVALLVWSFGAVSAFAATDLTMDWTGSIDLLFVSDDDATSHLLALGNTAGTFYAQDGGVSHYGYGVDDTNTWLKGTITDGGALLFDVDRLDSKTSYCLPGQETFSYVATDGDGYLNWRSSMNYAGMTNAQYGFASTNFGVSETPWGLIQHRVTSADGDYGEVVWTGTGSADIKLMGEKANNGFNMGYLPVCGDGEAWDNNYAKFTGTGTGLLTLTGGANDELRLHEGGIVIPGDGTPGSAYYSLQVGYAGSWSMLDFGMKGN